jgi:hypothetical protein
MRRLISLLAFMPLGLGCSGQSSFYDVGPSKGPQEVFSTIAPYYDFTDAKLRPWHLKVNYQLDGEKGNPSAQGVFEYWWVSPKVYRSTWTRGVSVRSEWHTADGRTLTQTKGEPFSVYEYWLRSAMLSPLPTAAELDSAESILVDPNPSSSGSHVRCIMVVPSEIKELEARALPFATYPEYCVNNARPILLGYYFFGSLLIKYSSVVEMQGKSMARGVYIVAETREILSASAEPVETIDSTDPALVPAPDAAVVNLDKTQISPEDGSALVVKKVAPTYSGSAKIGHDQGKVILRTTIGPDGGIQDVRLVSAQTPSLALPAFLSVAEWKFKPYWIRGKPVTAETTVEVNFPTRD